MLLELSVLPKNKRQDGNETAADLARIIDSSGLYHREKNLGTVLEGDWDELMAVAKKCHDEALKTNESFVTIMRAVDGPEVAPCSEAPDDCGAIKELLEDDGDWLIP